MKRKLFFLFAVALCMAMALPTKAQTDDTGTALETKSKKTLPYPRATKAVPASAMEYDSIAGCFVVRDTIVPSRAAARSGAARTVVTRAAVAYTEDGVQYGYFGDQLSSNNMAEMRQIVESWTTLIPNIDIDEVLSPAPDKETWYMQIVGVDNEEIDKADGEMRIYNDIGTTWNYKTIAIDSTALRGNEHIKKVVFEDCASASENANTYLRMVIHDGAFKDCKNLKEFNMYYLVTAGTNNYQMLYPWDIYIGDNVFDGCHPDFRIVVAPQLYNYFIVDDNWGKYADRIVASDYLPTTYDPITFEGVTYDYAANSLNTLPTSELTRLQSSWWNAAIIGAEVAIAIATWGIANSSITSAKASLQTSIEAAELKLNIAKWNLSNADLLLRDAIKSAVKYNVNLFLQSAKEGHKAALLAYTTAKEAYTAALGATVATDTYYMIAAGVSATSVAGVNGLSYIANTVGNKARRESTWAMTGQWLFTENKHTIYHMYVKDVENKETITLYNDIGSAYNYKTVAIGRDAFRGKNNLKTLKFEDVNTGEMYAPMTVVIPDSAFLGCSNLETVDFVMRSNYTDRDVALGPENFILCGEDIFAGCDTAKLKIRVGAEKYEEFAENTYWKKYKNCFEVVDVPENIDYVDFGAQYSYTFENNTLKKQTYIGEHTIEHLHIIGQDNEDLASQDGEVGLFNDIGVNNNYKLDYVKSKAFYGSEELKGISMFDLKGLAGFGDAYTDLSLALQDSAFAHCLNLEYINMLYFRTDGTNSVEPMDPSRVQLGDGVFAGSDKFKVKMVTTAVESFKADTAWAKYEDRFLPSFILTKDPVLIDILEDCGMEYESPITGGNFDVYDVMQVTDPAILNGKFQGKELTVFHEFKAFECIGLDHIGEAWFKDCTKLQGIELPSTLKDICKQVFYNCQLLDDVVIPAGVIAIGDEAFAGCTNLKSVTLLSTAPAGLGENVFANMPEDYVIYVPEAAVDAYKATWAQYADHIQTISNKHTGIFEVTLTEPGTLAKELGLAITGSNPLTVAGNYSKYDSLKVVGPVNGTDIGVIRIMAGRDVNNCEDIYPRNLKYLDLYDAHIKAGGEDYNQDGDNDRITEDDCIDTYMFWELDVLETLILPKSVTMIKDYAFNNCNALRRVVIGDNTKSIGEEVTHDSPMLQEVILLCNEAPATDADAWSEKTPIGIFYTPNSYRDHISGSRVYYTRGDSIASPFEDDALLRALAEKRIFTMNEFATLESVDNLINGNSEIKKFNELIMAVEVKELGDNSLSGCSNLEEVMLPLSVEKITAGAFNGCSSLMKVNAFSDTIPTLAENAFESLPEDFVIYVEAGKEDAYRKAWSQYADHIQGFKKQTDEIKVVTVTEPGTLADAIGFSVSMESADDIGRIGGDLISIKALKVNGPINGKDIAVLRMLGGRDEEDAEEVTLARMTYLDLYDATICTDPDNICFNRDGNNDYVENNNEIPEHMFWKLDRLQTVILPKNVTRIDDNAFYDCLNIETIVVGDATVYIGNDAFGKCKNLKNIVFLCNGKAELDGDVFTDPVSDQPYQVEKMYVPLSMHNAYVADREYTTHTKEFCSNYDEDALFRAYGSHAVMSDDQLRNVTNINGWFVHHNDITDLTSLGVSAVDSITHATFASLQGLKKIALPATLSVLEENAFAANTKLQYVDFANCENSEIITQSNIAGLGLNQDALIYAPEDFTASGLINVVYGSKDNLKCDHFTISDNREYVVPREFKADAVSYDRQFEKGEKTTLCLPFGIKVPAGVKAYIMSGEVEDAIFISQVDSLEAGKPYMVVADENMTFSVQAETLVPVTPDRLPQLTDEYFAMTGTLTPISKAEAAKQSLYILGDDACWHLVKGTKDAEPALARYRAFIKASNGDAPDVVNMYELIDDLTIADGNITTFENLEEKIIGTLKYTRTINNAWNALYVPFEIELTEEFLANYDVAYINDVRSYDWDDDGELDDWEVEIIKIKKIGKLKANHPYVIRPKSEEAQNLNITQHNTKLHSTAPDKQVTLTCSSVYKQYTIKGIYSKSVSESLDNGNYVYAVNKVGEWQKMALSTSLVPFRLYLTMANSDGSSAEAGDVIAQSIRMRLIGEESENGTTVIYDVEADEELKGENGKVKVVYDLQGRRVLEPKKGGIYIVNNRKVIF